MVWTARGRRVHHLPNAIMIANLKLRSCSIFLLLVVALFFVAIYSVTAHAISASRAKAITIGTPSKKVVDLVGEPTKIVKGRIGETWVYSGMTWCIYKVRFGSKGTVVGIEHDH